MCSYIIYVATLYLVLYTFIAYIIYSIEEFYSFYDIQKLSWNKVYVYTCTYVLYSCTDLYSTQL